MKEEKSTCGNIFAAVIFKSRNGRRKFDKRFVRHNSNISKIKKCLILCKINSKASIDN